MVLLGYHVQTGNKDSLLLELKKSRNEVVPEIIRFLILTGARLSEAVNLPWSELDLQGGIWTLPPERNKAKNQKIGRLKFCLT